MTYPITINITYMPHENSTKYYRVYVVSNADGASLLINQYASVGNFGRVEASAFGTLQSAAQEARKKINAKAKRGYTEDPPKTVTATDFDELRNNLGNAMLNELGISALKHLLPKEDMSAIKLGSSSKYRGREHNLRVSAEHLLSQEEREAAEVEKKRKEEERQRLIKEETEKKYASNDLYGRF